MKIKVGIIFGGQSVEHEISVISANQAIKALDKNKYDVIPIYISKERDFYVGELLNDIDNYKDLDNLKSKLTKVYLVKNNNKVVIEPVKKTIFSKAINTLDVVIPVIHGTYGEDGVLQGVLEMINVPYSSSDVIASAVGQDKVVMKCVLSQAGIKMVDWFWVYGFEAVENKKIIKEKAKAIGYPLIVKPACLGSSIGISFANNFDELMAGIEECSRYDTKIVIEKQLTKFRELNCAVLGSIYKCKASVIEEVGADSFLDFHGKYLNGKKGMASTKRTVPALIDEKISKEIKELAIKTFKQVGANGVCRIDFLLSEDNEVFVNEINNIPGSLAFYLWKHDGLEFSSLMEELVEIALNRAAKKEKLIFSYDTNILSDLKNIGGKAGKIKTEA